MNILVTGCAGFIGFHLCQKLLNKRNNLIYGIDNLNKYYDVNLKKDRLKILNSNNNFFFKKIDLSKNKSLQFLFKNNNFDIVINLAAQAGVRDSIKKPQDYFDNNINGFFNLINISSQKKIKHFIFASTSSVYGDSLNFPTSENENTDRPLSFYAASKKCNEVIAYSYSSIYNLPCTALRFFTVYGPYGRPDMALYNFVNLIYKKKKINLFNHGKHVRDFTYVNDVVNYINEVTKIIPKNKIPYQVYNIGSNKPQTLEYFLSLIKKYTKLDIKTNNLIKQRGDVFKTHANNTKIIKATNKHYYTPLSIGIEKFVKWYKDYYGNAK